MGLQKGPNRYRQLLNMQINDYYSYVIRGTALPQEIEIFVDFCEIMTKKQYRYVDNLFIANYVPLIEGPIKIMVAASGMFRVDVLFNIVSSNLNMSEILGDPGFANFLSWAFSVKLLHADYTGGKPHKAVWKYRGCGQCLL